MHNLALALDEKGFRVTGSDDEIFEPSRTRLAARGLLPEQSGWFPEKIHPGLDAVILGMHAREDNPELIRARELGLKIFSYPEYLYEQCRDKKRVVVGGSHGKTTITAMIMHVLRHAGIDFDYMAGALLEGFDTMVRLSNTARVAVFEGDEYLASTLDLRPKFHLYHPHIAILSGIAWDHVNVFPTFQNYLRAFDTFASLIEPGGELIYCSSDPHLCRLAENQAQRIKVTGYDTHKHEILHGRTSLLTPLGKIPLEVFGEHNLKNINAALHACRALGVTDHVFYQAISSFKGAAKRLQTLARSEQTAVVLDFAHSPSKVSATVRAMKQQFPERHLTACLELHTFSSLTESFLKEYAHSMDEADEAIVYYNPETLKHKHLALFDAEAVVRAFARADLKVWTDSGKLTEYLQEKSWKDRNLLIMTSGNFNGVSFQNLAASLTSSDQIGRAGGMDDSAQSDQAGAMGFAGQNTQTRTMGLHVQNDGAGSMSFSIRNARAEDMDFFIRMASTEGWNPGLADGHIFFETDPEGFFIAESQGKPVGCISAVSYGTCGFIGLFIVDKSLRGRLIGPALGRKALAYLQGKNMGVDGVLEKVPAYLRFGFEPAHRNIRYMLQSPPKPEAGKTPSGHICPASDVPFEALAAYDRSHFPGARERFLKLWLQAPTHRTAVWYHNGTIGAMGVLRACGNGSKIGPLFAQDVETADEIFRTLVSQTQGPVFLDVQAGHPIADQLVERYGMEKVFETMRMYSQGQPQALWDEVVGITTFELG